MRLSGEKEGVLSREELDALLEEMPQLLEQEEDGSGAARTRPTDVGLERANQEFAFEAGLLLSNRHQRVIHLGLIGHREIETSELAELMLPTDMAASFRVLPKDHEGFLLLSRPFFFHLLAMSFGAGPTMKPTRPPTREYTRIERRFYTRAALEMLKNLENAWKRLLPVEVAFGQLATRSAVAEATDGRAIMATFDVKGLAETCRIRVAIPVEPFQRADRTLPKERAGMLGKPGVSLLEVPLALRAQVGTIEMSLGDVARLEKGQILELEAPSDGSLEIRIGGKTRFKGVAGVQGARRAVQLTERQADRSGEDG